MLSRRNFLKTASALALIPIVKLPIPEYKDGRRVVDGRDFSGIHDGEVFENLHFTHPIKAISVNNCYFENCSADTCILLGSYKYTKSVCSNMFRNIKSGICGTDWDISSTTL